MDTFGSFDGRIGRACACGMCHESPKGRRSDFVPGHDSDLRKLIVDKIVGAETCPDVDTIFSPGHVAWRLGSTTVASNFNIHTVPNVGGLPSLPDWIVNLVRQSHGQ